jgi:hypothetical protein
VSLASTAEFVIILQLFQGGVTLLNKKLCILLVITGLLLLGSACSPESDHGNHNHHEHH